MNVETNNQNVQTQRMLNTDTYQAFLITTENSVSFTVEFDYVVSMKALIRGAEREKVFEKDGVAPWEKPLIKFKIPPRSRPGDKITIPNGWTTPDGFYRFDVVITLHLSSTPPFVVKKDDVYFRKRVRTNMRHKVRKERIEFPDGEVRDVRIYRVVKEPLLINFAGRGMPRRGIGKEGENGDFFIVIDPIAKKNRVRRFVSDLYRKFKSCLTGVGEN